MDERINTHAIIFAGGEGRRLRPLTYYFQKIMIPIGSKQLPLLEYMIRLLSYYNVNNITIILGYKGQQIKNYFDDGERFGVKINYFTSSLSLLGSGDALYNAYELGMINPNETLLFYSGDVLANINISDMLSDHWNKNRVLTLAITEDYQIPMDLAHVKNNKLIDIIRNPKIDIPVSIGILALESKILMEMENVLKKNEESDIIIDFIPYLIKKNYDVGTCLIDTFWYNLNTIEKYEKMNDKLIDEIFDHYFIRSRKRQNSD